MDTCFYVLPNNKLISLLQLRARRRRIRAAGDDYYKSQELDKNKSDSRSNLHHSKSISTRNQRSQVSRRHSTKPSLWQSRENIRQKDLTDDKDVVVNIQPTRPFTDDMPERRLVGHREDYIGASHYASRGRNYDQPSSRMISANNEAPKAPVRGDHTLPTKTASFMTLPGERKDATYRLISAALNGQNSHNNPPSNTRNTPIPAQRSYRVQRNLTASSSQQFLAAEAGSQPKQTLGYEKPQLYSESQRTFSRTLVAPSTRNGEQPGQSMAGDRLNGGSRQPLPSYAEVQGQRSSARKLQPQTNVHAIHAQTNQAPKPKARDFEHNSAASSNAQTVSKEKLLGTDSITTQTGESCCGSSNPDSGYGGQNYEFYASHPSPQKAAGDPSIKEYDSWYSRRLQDAARRINTYSGLRPQRTMTSDV